MDRPEKRQILPQTRAHEVPLYALDAAERPPSQSDQRREHLSLETVKYDDIKAAHDRLKESGLIIQTPCNWSEEISDKAFIYTYLKEENIQHLDSYKIRGSANAILVALATRDLSRGVCASTSGNHGLGLAYVCDRMNIPCTIFTSENVPEYKNMKIRQQGATVIVQGKIYDDADRNALAFAHHTGAHFIAPDDLAVIGGYGTVGLEIMEQVPDVTHIIVPVGGGALMAGIAAAVKSQRPYTRVIGVESNAAPSVKEALRWGEVYDLLGVGRSAAESLVVQSIHPNPLKILMDHGITEQDLYQVNDGQMKSAQEWLRKMGHHVELSGAAGVAGFYNPPIPTNNMHNEIRGHLFQHDHKPWVRVGHAKAVIVLTGGNVSL